MGSTCWRDSASVTLFPGEGHEDGSRDITFCVRNMVDLQCCVSVWYSAKCLSYTGTCILCHMLFTVVSHKILHGVPWALQQVLAVCFILGGSVNSKLLIYRFHLFPLWSPSVGLVSLAASLCFKFICAIRVLDSTQEGCHVVFAETEG